MAIKRRERGIPGMKNKRKTKVFPREHTPKSIPSLDNFIARSLVVVSFVEKYYPALTHVISPVVSHMIAHARMTKKSLGAQVKVIFAGSCTAKKDEASRNEHQGIVPHHAKRQLPAQTPLQSAVGTTDIVTPDFNPGYKRNSADREVRFPLLA